VASERHTREFWRRLSTAVDDGATIERTAQQHGVRPRTLSWWRWRLRHEAKKTQKRKKNPEAKLLPIVLRAQPPREVAAACAPIVVDILGEVALRVPVGTDVGYVAELVAAVRKTC
jgi:transposase-like protein